MDSFPMIQACGRHQHPELFAGEGAYIAAPLLPADFYGRATCGETPEVLPPSDRGVRGHRELLWNTGEELTRG